ncbi:Outer membrane protein IcsA autotransporter precursor [Variovorax sp. WDL1]|uniref:autotransporter outer membrane beta-barrel domain-containing protein n=2 Tax=Variovorax sp. WDL1 TaxID=207745 RepID=UPI001318FAED|nr:autotransporter outer membrane beta-barrel domain-containing protein [Variovorax sp. WDL1]VTV12888.1 Outer membrane protein IcsA autotransporter precursor [Variovorax sp. WDL1]
MNRMHRSLWNAALGAWVAAPEKARARGKRSGIARAGVSSLRLLASACLLTWAAPSAFACDAGDTASLASCIANAATDSTITLTASITLTGNIGVLGADATINGNGHTLDGASTYRGFFIGAGTATISNLRMQNLRALGGQGGAGFAAGGGGMGAGGAVFVANGAGANLEDVVILDNRAMGGSGGEFGPFTGGVGGGGGMGGNGGTAVPAGPSNGGGGGGLFADGAPPLATLIGGDGGGPTGGAGSSGDGGDGGAYTGGGGAGFTEFGVATRGGGGGLGGGGGGSGAFGSSEGGRGGFGGGGGGGNFFGGAGGFGGGGGSSGQIVAGLGGFGGGGGGITLGGGITGAGGGGAGMGGAIFVMEGGSLTLSGTSQVSGNGVVAGASGSGGGADDGSAFGSGIFMQGTSGTLAFAPDAGDLQTVADAIADQTGSGGLGANAGSIGVVKRGAGRLVLSGTNTYSGGTTVTGGTLSISSDPNLGTAAGPLTLDGGTLQNTAAVTTARAITIGSGGGGFQTDADLASNGSISGTGSVTKTGAGTLTLAGANTYAGTTTLSAGTLRAGAANAFNAASAVTLGGGATLDLNNFSQTIGSLAGFGFVTLGTGTLTAGGDNTSTTFSGVMSGNGGLIKIGTGTLTLDRDNTHTGGVTINAGTVRLDNGFRGLGADTATATVNSGGTLDLGGQYGIAQHVDLMGGTLTSSTGEALLRGTVTLGTGGTNTIGNDGTGLILEGAVGGDSVTIAGTGRVYYRAANTYTGTTTINPGAVLDTAASGTGNGSGITNNGTLWFEQDSSGAVSQDISGIGELVKFGDGTLTLSGANTYGGGTVISQGTLSVAKDENLGRASTGLALDGGTLRTTGAFATARNINLGSDGGTLQTDADLTASGTVSGVGVLTKTGAGMLTLSGENSYDGGTDLKQGGIAVGNNSALGTGELAMHEGTTLRFAADGLALANPIAFTDAVDPIVDTGPFTATLTGAITGPGDLSKIGSGTLILSGANSYGGATAVTEGTLRAGAGNTFSPASAHSVAAGATLDLAGFSQSIAGLANAGTVSLIGATPGTTLTVNGPYVGNNGLLRLGTFLGDSASASDRVILSGPAAAASGRTTVQVVNLGGLGALTTGNGIELVSALNGATTTAQSTKDAFALQGGHVDAGAFEYRLQPGDAAGGGENWYLRSTSTIIPPAPAELPAPAAAPIEVPTYRGEVPLFAAVPEQLRQGNLVMLSSLHQRIGDDDVRTAAGAPITAASTATGERRAWGRVLSTGRNIQQGGTVNPHSEGRLSGLQAGTDLWTNAHWRAGVYAGQLDGDMQVNGFARGIANLAVGSNDLRSQYLGGYATYTDPSGLYVDGVLQAGRHRYEVKPQANLRTKGKASSLSASLELGQSFALGEGWQIQPQAQLVHQRLGLDDVDIAGARVRQDRGSTWLARVGARVKGDIATSAGRLQPYARVNLYRASGGNDTTRFINPAASTAIASSRGGTSTELAAGFTLRLSESTSLYGEVGKLWDSGGDTRAKSQLNASAGVRVRW